MTDGVMACRYIYKTAERTCIGHDFRGRCNAKIADIYFLCNEGPEYAVSYFLSGRTGIPGNYDNRLDVCLFHYIVRKCVGDKGTKLRIFISNIR